MKQCNVCQRQITLFEFAHEIDTETGKPPKIFCRICAKTYQEKKQEEFQRDPSKEISHNVATNMTGKTFRVKVPVGGPLIFPRRCVCCDKPAETEMFHSYEHRTSGIIDVTTTVEKRGYSIPYCSICAKYRTKCSRAIGFGIAAFFVGYFSILGWEGIKDSSERVIYIFLFLLTIFLTYRALWPYFVRIRKAVKSCCLADAVCYIWSNTDPRGACFLFRSQNYAEEFARINGLSVENPQP